MSAGHHWHRRAAGAWSLALAASTVLVGCAATRPPITYPPPAVLPSAAELDAVLASRRTALHSLRALARLQYHDAHQSVAARQAIVVARPDRLRIEVLSLFGSAFLLVTDAGRMTAYARDENTVYRGLASPENLRQYVHLGLPVADLIDIVLGTPQPHPESRAEVAFEATTGAIRLHESWDHGGQSIWFSNVSLPIATEERNGDGETEWRATFAEYKEHRGIPIATRIDLTLPRSSQSMELTLRDIDVNPVLDDSVFAFDAPAGSAVVELRVAN